MEKIKSSKRLGVYQKRSLFATIILILAVISLLIFFIFRTNNFMKQRCYRELLSSTEQALEEIENNFRNDRVSLRMLARVIAEEESVYSFGVTKYLTIYDVNSLISNVAILTPENVSIQVKGNRIDTSGIIDYQSEVLLGEHISGLETSLTNPDTKVIRSYVPIRKDGKNIGMLYAEMSPSNIARAWTPEIYDRNVKFCIIDRANGDFLVNTWSDSLETISDLKSDDLASALHHGKTDFMEMDSEYFENESYISYMPMQIENWEIILSVPEKAVFQLSNSVFSLLKPLFAGELLLLMIYLLWILYNNRLSIIETEHIANTDVLTGLQNRNRYEMKCHQLDGDTNGLSCIYVDVNGLHEVNNSQGHVAGDIMLRFIADTLKQSFGGEELYRIGGDEFIAFQHNIPESSLTDTISKINERVQEKNYHISVGLCVASSNEKVSYIIKKAEKRMYENKIRYYQSIGKEVRNSLRADG